VETYRDPAAAIDDRVADLIDRMTVAEKLAQLGGTWLNALVRGDRIDREHVLATIPHGTGHVTRIGASTGLRPTASATLMNDIQRIVVEGTRLGIPVVVHEESTAGFCARDATVFPQAIGLGATWDEGLVGRIAEVIRRQMVAVGARHTLAPVLDVGRDARWGRVEETYGEDPYLIGRLGTAYVRAIQAADSGGLATGVIATGKHFLGYGASEGGLNHAPVHLGPRELREVFAEPFAAAIRDGGLTSIMNSYSSVDGIPCAGSAQILTALLREELGFDGLVVADYYAVALLMRHHRVAATPGEAAICALTAGLDLELPDSECTGAPLRDAVDRGDVPMAVIDRAVARVLRSKYALGLFERPYVDAGAAAAVYDTPADRTLAREAAARSIVLLHDDAGLLPLRPEVRRIAVVGPTSDDVRLLQGDYHYPAHVEIAMEGFLPGAGTEPSLGADAGERYLPESGGAFRPGHHYTPHVTPLAAMRTNAARRGIEVAPSAGCSLTGDDGDDAAIAEAAAVASGCDIVVVCVGGRSGLTRLATVGEARDASDLRLTGRQADLVRACKATGTPVVAVVMSGRVHDLSEVSDSCGALLLAWCPGEEGGSAIAEVLFGTTEPGGRLPVTMPATTGQVPVHHTVRQGGGRSMFYGDYADGPTRPLYPFGHGLGYTTFAYESLEVVSSGSTSEPVVLRARVRNTGARTGGTVVQLYGTDEIASVARHRQLLVGFTRIDDLEPGDAVEVTFTVHPSRLAFFDPDMRFVCEPGAFVFTVASSSAHRGPTVRVELDGDVFVTRQRHVVATAVEVHGRSAGHLS
jgi:beta-glucosidase